MKFIGQFIQNFIAKFKNDVYLEDISTGTIASGGNLGLDSNNKIVKATEATGDITGVTAGTNLSGGGASGAVTINLADASTSAKGAASFSSDNFAASSGAITIKDEGVDLSAEVTGRLPVGNGGTGVASLTDGGILIGSGASAITAAAVLGDGEILIGDGTTDPVALDVGSSTAITVLGTVATGTWQGTAIATDQQKHLAHFCFKGYGTGDGTNYEMQDFLSDTNAPYEHNTSTGSDGLTAQTPQVIMRTGGTVMPHAGTLKNWTGWAASAGSGTVDIGLFKFTPTRNSNSNVSAVLLINTQFTALGNAKGEDFAETSFSVAFAAGDMIVSAVKNGTSGKICYFSSTLEVEWS